MLAWTLIVVLTAPLFGTSEVSGQTVRGRASAGSRSAAGAQIFFRTSPGFSQTGVTTGHPTHSSVRRTVPPRRVAPGVAFVTPVAPAFHHFGRPFIHPVFPRHRRVLIIEVPGAIDA